MPSLATRVAAETLRLLPRKRISRGLGSIASFHAAASLPGGSGLLRQAIDLYVKAYDVDLGEAEIPPGGFDSFDAFFTRALRPGARPVEGGERITTDNRAIGTPGYMAPEQVVGVARVDARVDVYALGAVLYEMLSGELPVEGQTAMQLMASTAEDDPIPLAAWCPEHRGPVDALLMGRAHE